VIRAAENDRALPFGAQLGIDPSARRNSEIMVSTALAHARRLPLARAADEFALTTVLLFLAVTVVRWLRDPGSPLYIAELNVALAVAGVLSGTILTGLILTPPGRRSGGHMNPAVTVALWLMEVFPGRSVPAYVLAQLAGSMAGTGLGRLAWGHAVCLPPVDYAAIRSAPTWRPASVFFAEAGCMIILILVRDLPGPSRLRGPTAVRHRTVRRTGDR
jgi:hypothetical protein